MHKLKIIYIVTAVFSILHCFSQVTKETGINEILIPYRLGSKWGFCNKDAVIKIKPEYFDVSDIQCYWSDGVLFKNIMIVNKGQGLMAINHNNSVIINTNGFEKLSPDHFYYNVIYAVKNGKHGVYFNGKLIIPCIYDRIERIQNMSFTVFKGNLAGLINQKGEIIVPVEYYNIVQEHSKEAGSIFWVGLKDRKDIRIIYKDKDLSLPKENHSYKITDNASGNILGITPAKYFDIEELKEEYTNVILDEDFRNLVFVEKNNKKGLYDIIEGKLAIPCEYSELRIMEGLNNQIVIQVKKNGYYGFLNEKNAVLVPVEIDEVENFSPAYILHQKNKIGLLSKSLKYIAPKYISLNYSFGVFSKKADYYFDFYKVMLPGNKKGYISSEGKEYFKD